eukprot:scaffold294676_cov32-Prasinocladus_malaysianus.AAC.1
MGMVDLAHATGEHDGLEPLAALSVGDALAVRPRVAQHERLAKLVAVVGRTVGGVDEDLLRRGEALGVLEGRVLAGYGPLFQVEVARAVACRGDSHARADSSGMGVSDSSACAGLCTRVRCDGAGEVVCLGGEEEVVVAGADDAVGWVGLQGLLDELEEAGGHGLAIDDEVGPEEPVARVLRVGLPDVEELDSGGVALEVVFEQAQVVLEVLVVKGQAHLLVDGLQSGPALSHHRNGLDGRRDGVHREGLERLRVDLLGHAVVDQRGEPGGLGGGEARVGAQQEAPGDLHAHHLVQTARVADGHRIGGQSRGEAHAGPNLHQQMGMSPASAACFYSHTFEIKQYKLVTNNRHSR